MAAAAAQTDSQTMYNRFMKFNNVRGDVDRFGTNEQNNIHIVMQRYVESSDALCKAIVSHELAHMLKLEAQAATQGQFEQMATTFRAVVSSQHAKSVWAQLVEPEVLLMISRLAAPCADTLMLESIISCVLTSDGPCVLQWSEMHVLDVVEFHRRMLSMVTDDKYKHWNRLGRFVAIPTRGVTHYEHYHLHAKQFDKANGLIAYYSRVFSLLLQMPVIILQRGVSCIEDNRHDAKAMHLLRIRNISPAQRHLYDLEIRTFLAVVGHEFTPEQLTHFATKSTLGEAFDDRSIQQVALALQTVVENRAETYYLAAKRDLELRSIVDCNRNARLAIGALNLSVYCFYAQHTTILSVRRASTMHLTKMLLSLNRQLSLAQKQEVLAQNAANTGDLMRTTLYIEKATEHLDRYDIILKLVNPMLLERFKESVEDLHTGAAVADLQQTMQEIESASGPVSTTVRERVEYESISQAARRNMLRIEAENPRRSLLHRMQNLDI